MLLALQDNDSALSLVNGKYNSFSLTPGISLAPSEASTNSLPEYQLIRGGGLPEINNQFFCNIINVEKNSKIKNKVFSSFIM